MSSCSKIPIEDATKPQEDATNPSNQMISMKKCGVCLNKQQMTNVCSMCQFNICKKCISRYCSVIESYNAEVICSACAISFISIDTIRPFYCVYCDEIVPNGSHAYHEKYTCNATKYNKHEPFEYRKLLPHYKAKPIIEEFLHIEGIAQLIFVYYYKPRRYFGCEM